LFTNLRTDRLSFAGVFPFVFGRIMQYRRHIMMSQHIKVRKLVSCLFVSHITSSLYVMNLRWNDFLKKLPQYYRFYCHICSFYVQNVTQKPPPINNFGYITVENRGHQDQSPIQGSVFSASSVAEICENKGAHSTNNIFKKYKIVY